MAPINALGLLAVLTFSFHGWGWAFRRAFRLTRGRWAVTVALGLAITIFLGGILNLGRLATPWPISCVVLVGTLPSVFAFRRQFPRLAALRSALGGQLARDPWTPAVVVGLTAVVLLFVIATQLPPQAFNYHDDFQKYFVHPVRMLQTGTVFGSTLSSIGLETLGGQAFLDGIAITIFPLGYLNFPDAVFGLFLCLMLAGVFTGGRRNLLAATTVGMLAVIFINPQSVNISSLYLGSALIMAAIALSAELPEMGDDSRYAGPNPAAMGMLYAALIAMKTTFGLFPVMHVGAIAAVIYFGTGGWRASLKWGFLAVFFTGVFLSPWLLLHAPHYLAAWRAPAPPAALAGAHAIEDFSFFSINPMIYGATVLHYSGIIAAATIGGMGCLWAASRADDRRRRLSSHLTATTVVGGAVSYILLVKIFGPWLSGSADGLRFFIPLVIGIVPAAFGLTAFHFVQSERIKSPLWRIGLPLVLAFVPVAAFWPSLHDRARQALNAGSVLAFSQAAQAPEYLDYCRQVMLGTAPRTVAAVQAVVPPGEPIIAWINAPFYLDFKRNPITDVEPAGLTTPWAALPPARYVIWEYQGFATRSGETYTQQTADVGARERLIAVRSLLFIGKLGNSAQQGQILYDDGSIAVFRLAESAVSHPASASADRRRQTGR